jgi:hypothetical protein
MPSATPTAISGKQFTFTYATHSGTAQTTSSSISQAADSETLQTWGGSVVISKGVESTVSCDFLYDGEQSGSFYQALSEALAAGTPGEVVIWGGKGAGEKWTGSAVVTSLGVELPADGQVTCSAEFAIAGALTFAPKAGTLAAK